MKLEIGQIQLHSIVEQAITGLEHLIKEANPETLAAIDWLAPHYINDAGELTGLVQSFVLDTGEHRLIVDTCVGNDKERPHDAQWHQQQRAFMQDFRDTGFSPESIDVVLCTHLHVDHVGWNCTRVNNEWRPSFPNARYLFERREFEYWQQLATTPEPPPPANESRKDAALRHFRETQRLTWADSVEPLVQAGLVELVDVSAPYLVCPGVSLIPTPGHTIGHVSVLLQSNEQTAVISGDCVHHPCQIANPPWQTLVDHDHELAARTREQLFSRLANDGGTLIGSHFSTPCCGTVRRDGNSFRFLPK
ncbi:MAG: MBL fold metallo-hydrolase [Burkholderiaceae bacterium]